MKYLEVTKIFRFSAAHKLPNHQGLCKELHGHNYKLEVTIGGAVKENSDPEKGMVIDFSNVKTIVNETVMSTWDHRLLNEFMENPTAENMVLAIAKTLRAKRLNIVRLKLWETDDSFVEWFIRL